MLYGRSTLPHLTSPYKGEEKRTKPGAKHSLFIPWCAGRKPTWGIPLVFSQTLPMSPSPQPSPTRSEGVARISSPLMGED